MNYQEVVTNARTCIGTFCKACNECNGKVCKNQIPGPGAKGVGDTANAPASFTNSIFS